jgi:hypothetical protein
MEKLVTLITTAFNSDRFIKRYFEGVLRLDALDKLRVVMIMNEPSAFEEQTVLTCATRDPDLFCPVLVRPRETIGASLNRGLAFVETPYVALLDVDDLRTPDSIMKQAETLDRNSDAVLTYGDKIIVKRQGNREGTYVSAPEFDRDMFTSRCLASPTQLFRRDLVPKVGGFDEQLPSGADFDFQVRAALNGRFVKTPGLMCYYTHMPGSQTASQGTRRQPIERTVVELRYGCYRTTMELKGYEFMAEARRYRLGEVKLGGKWEPLARYVPGYEERMRALLPEEALLQRRHRRWRFFDKPSGMPARAATILRGRLRGLLDKATGRG